jgi:crotonobetainyl-CoA:carnitine CoA-transferase CaiB-like acyl-CoA transferase
MPPSAPDLPIRQDVPLKPGPLAGVRVIDFTRVLAGPFATQILGDFGAVVIKIENPHGGDDTRSIRPSPDLGGETAFFMSLNRSKQSVAIDLKSEAGREIALDLIAQSDVLVENFTGSVMRGFKLDYASLHDRFPRLIYCSISGYGRTGRNADAAGYDSPLSAEGGATALNANTGGQTVLGAIPYTDISTALNATIGILAALQARTSSGIGQHVDVAMFDSTLANLSFVGCEFLISGRETRLYDRRGAGPNGIFETADGEITITCGKEKMFRALCLEVVERPEWLEDPRYATIPERMRNGEAFLKEIVPVFKSHPGEYWSERCKRAGIPCGEIRNLRQALFSQEARDRGLVFGIPHPTAGVTPVIAQPVRFSETPCRYEVPPLLGQHTGEVLHKVLGYTVDRISELERGRAISLASGLREPTESANIAKNPK